MTYKEVQYLLLKIWLISVWRLKARAMKWLLTWFMFAQSTLISYHTEAFVKTEVGCTVYQSWLVVQSLKIKREGKIFFLILNSDLYKVKQWARRIPIIVWKSSNKPWNFGCFKGVPKHCVAYKPMNLRLRQYIAAMERISFLFIQKSIWPCNIYIHMRHS